MDKHHSEVKAKIDKHPSEVTAKLDISFFVHEVVICLY